MGRYPIHRTDSTAAARLEELHAYGWEWLTINGAIDGIAWKRYASGVVAIYFIDFKGPKTAVTDKQQDLIRAGFPLKLVETADDLRAVLFGEHRS